MMSLQRRHQPRARNRTIEQRQVANLRERRRMLSIYNAFETLRHKLPLDQLCITSQKITRLQVLRLALDYIKALERILEMAKFVDKMDHI